MLGYDHASNRLSCDTTTSAMHMRYIGSVYSDVAAALSTINCPYIYWHTGSLRSTCNKSVLLHLSLHTVRCSTSRISGNPIKTLILFWQCIYIVYSALCRCDGINLYAWRANDIWLPPSYECLKIWSSHQQHSSRALLCYRYDSS